MIHDETSPDLKIKRHMDFEVAIKFTSVSFCQMNDFNLFVFLSKWVSITEKRLKLHNFENRASSFLFLGHWYLLLLDYRSAYLTYKHALLLDKSDILKDNPDLLYGLGISAGYIKFYQRAVKSLLRLLYLFPDYDRAADARLRLALIFKNLKHFSRSRHFFRQACYDHYQGKCSVPLLEVLLSYGHLLELMGEHCIAKNIYEYLLTKNDISNDLRSKIYQRLSTLFYESFKVAGMDILKENAAKYAMDACKLDNNNLRAAYLHGLALSLTDRASESFHRYRECVDGGSEVIVGQNTGTPGENVKKLGEFCSKNASDAWCMIANLYRKQKQVHDAVQAYICSIRMDSNNYASWINIGQIYEVFGEIEEALYAYNYACEIKSTDCLLNRINVLNM